MPVRQVAFGSRQIIISPADRAMRDAHRSGQVAPGPVSNVKEKADVTPTKNPFGQHASKRQQSWFLTTDTRSIFFLTRTSLLTPIPRSSSILIKPPVRRSVTSARNFWDCRFRAFRLACSRPPSIECGVIFNMKKRSRLRPHVEGRTARNFRFVFGSAEQLTMTDPRCKFLPVILLKTKC